MIDFDNGFRGRAVSARLISNCISYGPRPAPDALVEQHLTLSADGTAALRCYCYGDGIDYLPQPQQTAIIRPEDARMLLDAVGAYFFQPQDDLFATDVGVWSLTLTSDDGKSYYFDGSLCPLTRELDAISQLLRDRLELPTLLAFDGAASPDRIERMTLDFRHRAGGRERRSEQIVLDRAGEVLKIEQYAGDGVQLERCLRLPGQIAALLDGVDFGALSEPFEPMPDRQELTVHLMLLHGHPQLLRVPLDAVPPELKRLLDAVRALTEAQPLPKLLKL